MNFLNIFEKLPLFLNFLIFIIGAAVLIKGSDLFVDSAVYFAKKFHISEIVIGLTLVSIGTSLPELAATFNSAIKGRSAIAIGNVTGSNVTNIALIIGISSLLIGNIKVPKKLLSRDTIFMIAVTVLLLVFSYFFDENIYQINRIESLIMFILLIAYLFYLFKFSREDISNELTEHEELKINNLTTATVIFLIGLIGLIVGSELMIRNVIVIAEKLNLNDGVLGATIVALTTSIPELSVTIVGIVKNRSDISLGNIIGSNIFNILGVLGITGMFINLEIINVADGSADTKMLFWNVPVTLLISVLLFIFMMYKKSLGRIRGIIFLLFYIGFIYLNFINFSF